MMKSKIFLMMAIAVLVMGTAQLSRADLIISISINGGAATTFTCAGNAITCSLSASSGDVSITTGAGSNLPGGMNALNTQSNSTVNNRSASAGYADIQVVATGFTGPLSPNVVLALSGSTTAGYGLTSFTSSGGGSITNDSTISTSAGSCSITATLGACGEIITPFPTGAGPYALITNSHIVFAANAGFSGTTTLTASQVPEPASMMLLGSGLLGLGGMVRRKLGK